MRKYLLPVVLLGAIGAVIVILMRMGGEERRPTDPPPALTGAADEPRESPTKDPLPSRPPTRTALAENRWMSELERAMARPDLSHAAHFQQKVCEEIGTIAQDPTLARKLLDDIREFGIESKDPRRRDIMLQILRVFEHPEATAMIDSEYYRAQSADESLMLLEAMAHEYHDPERASVWAVEKALSSDSEEHRMRSFEVINELSNNRPVAVKTGIAIYEGTIHEKEQIRIIEKLAVQARQVPECADWLRKRLRDPRPAELTYITSSMGAWGVEKDAAYLERLAEELPAFGDQLREHAEQIRMARRIEANPHEPHVPSERRPGQEPSGE